MDQDALISRLPASIASRVRSAKLADGVATLVLDVSGLDASKRGELEEAVRDILGQLDEIAEVRVAMTAEKVQRRIVAIGSGKGGVGKSTLTANLAVALHRMGRKVGVVDADIYGPSQPTLLDNQGERPQAEEQKLIPVQSPHGIPVLSMGHLVEPGKAIAWRGPMAGNALGQLIDAHWGEVDTLLVDLPPGTGDVQLSMLQKHKPAGAVIVSTPQDLALIDAQRAAQLFDAAGVPLIGLVENMAGYVCPNCGEISDPFGQGGVEAAAKAMDVPFMGRIPLNMAIREASDGGTPPATRDDDTSAPFRQIAEQLAAWLDA
ncbi:Mrp/NBP35 family ATP-binding protein [Altererythrobacter sp. MF3-039]|uniref:Mrp/NBP35 family ATP-binding protein n=1 Tax=Altererythrobacter sp. MF3-039 TaxID=3252901 RepID=UPI00390CB1B7